MKEKHYKIVVWWRNIDTRCQQPHYKYINGNTIKENQVGGTDEYIAIILLVN
jgi:hypothetical protein